jgi:hypothetical protein
MIDMVIVSGINLVVVNLIVTTYLFKLLTTEDNQSHDYKIVCDYEPLSELLAKMNLKDKVNFHDKYLHIEHDNLSQIRLQEDLCYFRIALLLNISYRELPDKIVFNYGESLIFTRTIYKREVSIYG